MIQLLQFIYMFLAKKAYVNLHCLRQRVSIYYNETTFKGGICYAK